MSKAGPQLPATPKCLVCGGQKLQIVWCRERALLYQLAPTRRVLIYPWRRTKLSLCTERTVRGFQCKQSDHDAQYTKNSETLVLGLELCEKYLVTVYKVMEDRWRRASRISTSLVRKSGRYAVRKRKQRSPNMYDHFRMYFKRNFVGKESRLFNPNNPGIQWLNTAHNATLDTQAHIESARRRLRPSKKQLWEKRICHLVENNHVLPKCLTGCSSW